MNTDPEPEQLEDAIELADDTALEEDGDAEIVYDAVELSEEELANTAVETAPLIEVNRQANIAMVCALLASIACFAYLLSLGLLLIGWMDTRVFLVVLYIGRGFGYVSTIPAFVFGLRGVLFSSQCRSRAGYLRSIVAILLCTLQFPVWMLDSTAIASQTLHFYFESIWELES